MTTYCTCCLSSVKTQQVFLSQRLLSRILFCLTDQHYAVQRRCRELRFCLNPVKICLTECVPEAKSVIPRIPRKSLDTTCIKDTALGGLSKVTGHVDSQHEMNHGNDKQYTWSALPLTQHISTDYRQSCGIGRRSSLQQSRKLDNRKCRPIELSRPIQSDQWRLITIKQLMSKHRYTKRPRLAVFDIQT